MPSPPRRSGWSCLYASHRVLRSAVVRTFRTRIGHEQDVYVHVEPTGDPLERSQCQIPLAAFEAAHVRAMDAEDDGEGLLTETVDLPVATEICPDGSLKIAFHDRQDRKPAT